MALAVKAIFYIADMGELEAKMGETFGSTQTLVAWFVVFAHGAGGAALALGFGTRWAAGLNALVLSGAVALHLAGTTGLDAVGQNLNFQFAALVLAVLLVFLWQGAGKFSLDRLIRSDDQPTGG